MPWVSTTKVRSCLESHCIKTWKPICITTKIFLIDITDRRTMLSVTPLSASAFSESLSSYAKWIYLYHLCTRSVYSIWKEWNKFVNQKGMFLFVFCLFYTHTIWKTGLFASVTAGFYLWRYWTWISKLQYFAKAAFQKCAISYGWLLCFSYVQRTWTSQQSCLCS